MRALIFRILSTDKAISARWQKAFQEEGWQTEVDASYFPHRDLGQHRTELDLMEIGVPECDSREIFQSVLKTRRPVSALVFGDPQKVSNRQIAAFLDAGADDFIFKNIDERILVAKLKAHLRRIMPTIAKAAAKLMSSCRSVEIDRRRRAVRIATPPGKYTELSTLTPKEFDILSLLVAQECTVVTREDMLERLWGDGATDVYSECIDKHVESLRRKLGIFGKKIVTVYGSGYMFAENRNKSA